jgi:hypothetical protein
MILMDAAIIGVQYSGLFDIHVTLKALAYSIKLKLEYAILGKLVHFTEMSHSTNSAPTDLSDFVDLSFHQNNQRPPAADSESQARFLTTPDTFDQRGPSKQSSNEPRISDISATGSSSNEIP